MGQAKARGTFDERRKAAIARNEQKDAERREEARKRELALTPQERADRHEAQTLLATVARLTVGLSIDAPPAVLEAFAKMGSPE